MAPRRADRGVGAGFHHEGGPVVASHRSGSRMSLADVARAAKVERPVASMWRKRTNRAGVAFPDPVGERDGHPEFDAHEVADFLTATGLGNNPRRLRASSPSRDRKVRSPALCHRS